MMMNEILVNFLIFHLIKNKKLLYTNYARV